MPPKSSAIPGLVQSAKCSTTCNLVRAERNPCRLLALLELVGDSGPNGVLDTLNEGRCCSVNGNAKGGTNDKITSGNDHAGGAIFYGVI